jgi:hypothetical protein
MKGNSDANENDVVFKICCPNPYAPHLIKPFYLIEK